MRVCRSKCGTDTTAHHGPVNRGRITRRVEAKGTGFDHVRARPAPTIPLPLIRRSDCRAAAKRASAVSARTSRTSLELLMSTVVHSGAAWIGSHEAATLLQIPARCLARVTAAGAIRSRKVPGLRMRYYRPDVEKVASETLKSIAPARKAQDKGTVRRGETRRTARASA
jgi:hypothetical protein